jgi:hypothetical protein
MCFLSNKQTKTNNYFLYYQQFKTCTIMKKCFLNVTTVMCTLLAMASFAGCSNDDNILPAGGDGDMKTVELKLSLSGLESGTRAASSHVSGALKLDTKTLNVIFYDANGLITAASTFTWATDGTMQEPTNFTVPSSSTHVAVMANTTPAASYSAAVGDWFYDTTNSWARQTLSYTTQKDDDGDINIYGSAELGNRNSDVMTAAVTIAPTVARFEITDISLGTGLTSFKVVGVFMDQFYKSAAIDGKNRTDRKLSSSTAANYADNAVGYYPTADKTVTYDYGSWEVAADKTHPNAENTVTTGTGGKVWGYYAFAQPYTASYNHNSNTATNAEPPTFVLKITNVTPSNGTLATAYSGKTFFVTIKGFKYESSGTKDVHTISAGYVYATSEDGLAIDLSDLKSEPYIEPKAADITVTPITWGQVATSPVLDDDDFVD